MLSFMTGPVELSESVLMASRGRPISHRSGEVQSQLSGIRLAMHSLTSASRLAVMPGGGTLANDAIATHLSTFRSQGLIVIAGEFGLRLAEHARRAGLRFGIYRVQQGQPLDFAEMDKIVGSIDWVWSVHCETSTGVMLDIERLDIFASSRGARLILDCVSTVGAVPLDLSGLYMASMSSGKALASVAGLALVAVSEGAVLQSERVPPALDLERHLSDTPPNTVPSGAIAALHASLVEWPRGRYEEIQGTGVELRRCLEDMGLRIVARRDCAAPHVVTIALPPELPAHILAQRLRDEHEIEISWASEYLRVRNWVQIATMGHHPAHRVEDLIAAMSSVLERMSV